MQSLAEESRAKWGGPKMSEPACLRRGKRFHKRVQEDWRRTAEGEISIEKTIPLLPSSVVGRRRRGRMDVFVGEDDGMVAVVEIKATDWDRVKQVRKVLGSHERQVWKYVTKHLDGDGFTVCPGIIYPTAPSTPGLKEEIEEFLNDNGLQVVWYDD